MSYLTVLAVNNDDLSLRPGMTATAEITTAQVRDALLVPSGALRFTPPDTGQSKPKSSGGITSMLGTAVPHATRSKNRPTQTGMQRLVGSCATASRSPST